VVAYILFIPIFSDFHDVNLHMV